MNLVFRNFEIDDARDRIDPDAVWGFLSAEASWGRWRTRSIVDSQCASAWRLVGAYEQTSGQQVAFARAISDGYGVAYLADVYVLEAFRGVGLGAAIVRFMIETGPAANFRWMLHADDARPFYRRLGFQDPDERYLERPSPLTSPGS